VTFSACSRLTAGSSLRNSHGRRYCRRQSADELELSAAIALLQFLQVVASHQKEFKDIYPRQGWMEEDPEEIVASCMECVDKAIEQLEAGGKYSRSDIAGIGITNQRESTVVWDKKTGKPLHNIIVWPDTRNTGTVKALAKKSPLGLDAVKEKVRFL
jgi:glycerol kinase